MEYEAEEMMLIVTMLLIKGGSEGPIRCPFSIDTELKVTWLWIQENSTLNLHNLDILELLWIEEN